MQRRGGALRPLIVETERLVWRYFDDAPGVSYKRLRHHDGKRGITLLLRFDPGASYPSHRHPGGEEYWVLDGTLDDGRKSYGTHTYVYHPPGSVHQPSSRTGCTLLVFLPEHIEKVPVD